MLAKMTHGARRKSKSGKYQIAQESKCSILFSAMFSKPTLTPPPHVFLRRRSEDSHVPAADNAKCVITCS